ncbi:MAG: hypothetical protein AABZ60_17970, partial [Planctomycetota bacterium]
MKQRIWLQFALIASIAFFGIIHAQELEEASSLLKSFNNISEHLKTMLSSLTERQQELFLNKNVRIELDLYLSILTAPSNQNEVYQNLLAYRGATARVLRSRQRFLTEPE